MNKYLISILSLLLSLSIQAQLKFQTLFESNSESSVSCFRIPSLTTSNSGVLIAAIDERVNSCKDLGDNQDINIVMKRSLDNGKTWSESKKIIDYPYGESASDPSFIVDKFTKNIFLFFNYMDHKKNNGFYRFKYIKSNDDGNSWSKPVDITNEISMPHWKKDFMFITSGKGYQTADGLLLHTVVNLENGTHVFGSKNHGESWFIVKSPLIPGDESKIIELANKNWMVNSRVNGYGKRFIHLSSDRGNSWESNISEELNDPGCNASLIRFNDKIILFSNVNNSKNRENLTIRISEDEGVSWSRSKTIYDGSAAYSSMSVLQNGEVGIFFEIDNYKKNVFTKFTFEWLDNF